MWFSRKRGSIDKEGLKNMFNLHGDRVLGDIPNFPENKINPPEIADSARKAGLGTLLVPDTESKERGALIGTIYVYDRKRLQRLLNENKEMLKKAEWPQKADQFVEQLSWVVAPANTDIYAFIARLHDVDGGKGPPRRWAGAEDERAVEGQRAAAYISRMKYHALKHNDSVAAKWMETEASKGQNIATMLYTSMFYARGAGVKQDYAEAAFWAGLATRGTIPHYRQMIREKHPNIEFILGKDVTADDSDAALSAAVAAHGQLPDSVKLRDTAMAQLMPGQRDAVQKRIEEWRPARPPAPAQSMAQPSSSLPPGFRVWK
ncbi:MAG: sel1 repeat family protein [Alphaproteobacteria bacterium]|nr:MAG: sel1 repeat family protein [Alphaproteobacteria bacterium]